MEPRSLRDDPSRLVRGAGALYVTHSAHDIIAPRFVCGSVVMISALWFWIDLVRMAL